MQLGNIGSLEDKLNNIQKIKGNRATLYCIFKHVVRTKDVSVI